MGLRHTAARTGGTALAVLLTTAGLGVPAAHAVTTDTTAPTISDIGIADGTTINGTITVNSVVSDDVAVTKVELRHFHLTAATSIKAPFTLSWNSDWYSGWDQALSPTTISAVANG